MTSDTDPLHTYECIAIRLHILSHPIDGEFTDAHIVDELAGRHYYVRPAAVDAVFAALHTEGLVRTITTEHHRHTCAVTPAGRMALARERRALRQVVLTIADHVVHPEH